MSTASTFIAGDNKYLLILDYTCLPIDQEKGIPECCSLKVFSFRSFVFIAALCESALMWLEIPEYFREGMTDIPDILFGINLLKPRFSIWNSQKKKKKRGELLWWNSVKQGQSGEDGVLAADLNLSGLPLASWSCEFNELMILHSNKDISIVVNMCPIDWAQCPQSQFF